MFSKFLNLESKDAEVTEDTEAIELLDRLENNEYLREIIFDVTTSKDPVIYGVNIARFTKEMGELLDKVNTPEDKRIKLVKAATSVLVTTTFLFPKKATEIAFNHTIRETTKNARKTISATRKKSK